MIYSRSTIRVAAWFCALAICSLATAATAFGNDLAFAPLFTSDMVLQRGVRVPVYGTGNPGDKIVVSFGKQTRAATIGSNGKWKVLLDPMGASKEPRSLTVASLSNPQQSMFCENVVVGDVWICSGQSNMQRPIRSYSVLAPALKDVREPNIRLLTFSRAIFSDTPREVPEIDAPNGRWHDAEGDALLDTSPAAFYFGQKLRRDEGIPVGLILAACGGTRIESWLPGEVWAQCHDDMPQGYKYAGVPASALYNGMIAPLTGFAVKGIVWYQGESNSAWPDRYAQLFPALIRGWREVWGKSDLPFLFVQLPGHKSAGFTGDSWAWLREAQQKALTLRNTGMVVATDLGEFEDLHPQNKRPVGERLALLAEGFDGLPVQAHAPSIRGSRIEGDHIAISFDSREGALTTKRIVLNKAPGFAPGQDPNAFVVPEGNVAGFTICGPDKKFVPADAQLQGDQVLVRSVEVAHPLAVRYAWKDFPLCNLFGGNGLPVASFRTDDFPVPSFFGQQPVSTPFTDTAGVGFAMDLIAKNSETNTQSVAISGIEGLRALRCGSYSGRMIYADIDRESMGPGNGGNVVVTLVFLDEGPTTIQVLYDSSDSAYAGANGPGTWKPLGHFRTGGTGSWRKVEFEATDALFARRLNGHDIRIQWDEDVDGTIAGCYVRKMK